MSLLCGCFHCYEPSVEVSDVFLRGVDISLQLVEHRLNRVQLGHDDGYLPCIRFGIFLEVSADKIDSILGISIPVEEMVSILIDYILVGRKDPLTKETPVEIHWNF